MNVEMHDVSADEAGLRLDRLLRRHRPGLTQGVIERLCRTGQVRIDGRRVISSTRVLAGQSVRIPPIHEIDAKPRHKTVFEAGAMHDLVARILYQDDDVIVLDKPAGLPTQGGKGIALHLDGMLDALKFKAKERPRLVHRLDRGTSGALVLARSAFAAAALAKAFRRRDTLKIYWALVVGLPVPLEGQIDLDLVRISGSSGARTKPVSKGHQDAAHAITNYRTLDHAGRKFAWLELEPLTGRTHQLRAHCAAIGTPILGDLPYAGERAHAEGFARQLHLHARRLELPHPRGGVLIVEADPPLHLRASLTALGFTVPRAAAPEYRLRN